MKCTVCGNIIDKHYCSECGQFYKPGRLTFFSVLSDSLSNLIALDSKFAVNVKALIGQFKKVVTNYWDGFRGYYYSPFRLFLIALFLLMIYLQFDDNFLGITVKIQNVSEQWGILSMLIVLFSIAGFFAYIFKKKNFTEHLVLNVYSISLWTIIFVPFSFLVNYWELESLGTLLFVAFLLLILIWNSFVFARSVWQVIGYVLLNIFVLSIFLTGVYYVLKLSGVVE